ncbi:DUF2946 family protein [Aquipseudomonas ullengensis]|uniref:DUF2946 domain-containing protein n=1 Tax=Aquipseudomonas ullengensis TaxID=2759166 RepID=A0A7W4LLC9_9GAMM|nr:DUF2946 family protein [Pseudomonas ullengensis]MBB2495267.1 DUF2946 domain-containing protein [Pseudomonas ullengensis]
MNLARDDRSLIAWVLYASVLFSLFACGIHHGQMSGLSLSGLNGAFCSVGSDSGPGVDLGGSQSTQQATASFSCPLCSSFAVAVAINSASWALDYVPGSAVAPIIVRSWAQPPPRYQWPSLNPRASPAYFPAVTQAV